MIFLLSELFHSQPRTQSRNDHEQMQRLRLRHPVLPHIHRLHNSHIHVSNSTRDRSPIQTLHCADCQVALQTSKSSNPNHPHRRQPSSIHSECQRRDSMCTLLSLRQSLHQTHLHSIIQLTMATLYRPHSLTQAFRPARHLYHNPKPNTSTKIQDSNRLPRINPHPRSQLSKPYRNTSPRQLRNAPPGSRTGYASCSRMISSWPCVRTSRGCGGGLRSAGRREFRSFVHFVDISIVLKRC